MQFYRLNKLISEPAEYYCIIGGRSNGKTYSVLEYCLRERFKGDDHCFVIIRRSEESTSATKTAQMIRNMTKIVRELWGDEYVTRVYGGKILLQNLNETQQLINMPVLGYIIHLAQADHIKGNDYSDVTVTLNDEMIPSVGSTIRYSNEFQLYLSIISTICRHRTNVKNFLTGNTERTDSPFFAGWKIRPELLEQGKIYNFRCWFKGNAGTRIRLEYAEPLKTDDNQVFVSPYLAFDGTYTEMAVSGGWKIDEVPEKYNGKTIEELTKTRDYINGITIDVPNFSQYITISNNINNPILITQSPVADTCLHLSGIRQIEFYPQIRRMLEYKLRGNMVFGDMFALGTFKNLLEKTRFRID